MAARERADAFGYENSMTSASRAAPAQQRYVSSLQLRGGSFTLLVLRLADPKDQGFYSWLADRVMQAPNFFRHAPVVIDLQDLREAPPFNIAELGRRLRQHWLVPIGVQNGTEEQNKAAVNAGLSLLPEGRDVALDGNATGPTVGPKPALAGGGPDDERRDDQESDDEVADEAGFGRRGRLVTQPVRSGRQVYASQGDLVVLSSISPGAELLADGHIHVYGALRGRAIAGVSGDTQARIFCHSLEAELISVAGYWRVREDIPDHLIGKPVQIFLDQERVMIEALP